MRILDASPGDESTFRHSYRESERYRAGGCMQGIWSRQLHLVLSCISPLNRSLCLCVVWTMAKEKSIIFLSLTKKSMTIVPLLVSSLPQKRKFQKCRANSKLRKASTTCKIPLSYHGCTQATSRQSHGCKGSSTTAHTTL